MKPTQYCTFRIIGGTVFENHRKGLSRVELSLHFDLSGQKFIENAKNCETVKYYYQKDQF